MGVTVLKSEVALDAKIPYTGATSNVDLGNYTLFSKSPVFTQGIAVEGLLTYTIGKLDFQQSTEISTTAGTLNLNAAGGSGASGNTINITAGLGDVNFEGGNVNLT